MQCDEVVSARDGCERCHVPAPGTATKRTVLVGSWVTRGRVRGSAEQQQQFGTGICVG